VHQARVEQQRLPDVDPDGLHQLVDQLAPNGVVGRGDRWHGPYARDVPVASPENGEETGGGCLIGHREPRHDRRMDILVDAGGVLMGWDVRVPVDMLDDECADECSKFDQ